MRTLASLMDLPNSDDPLFPICNYAFINICLYTIPNGFIPSKIFPAPSELKAE